MSNYKYMPLYEATTIINKEPIAIYKIANLKINVYDKKDIPNKFIRFWQKHILGINWELY